MAKGDTLYAWQERTASGWGTIAASIPALGTTAPLIARELHVARTLLEPLARSHVKATGNPLRLARFRYDGDVV